MFRGQRAHILLGLALALLACVEACAQVICLGGNSAAGASISLLMADFNWYDFPGTGTSSTGCNGSSAGGITGASFIFNSGLGCGFQNGDIPIRSTSWAFGQGSVSTSSAGASMAGIAIAGMGEPL